MLGATISKWVPASFNISSLSQRKSAPSSVRTPGRISTGRGLHFGSLGASVPLRTLIGCVKNCG